MSGPWVIVSTSRTPLGGGTSGRRPQPVATHATNRHDPQEESGLAKCDRTGAIVVRRRTRVDLSPSASRRLSVRVAGRVSRAASGRSPTRVHAPPTPQCTRAVSTPSSKTRTSSSITRARTTSIAVSDAMSRPDRRRSEPGMLEIYPWTTPGACRTGRFDDTRKPRDPAVSCDVAGIGVRNNSERTPDIDYGPLRPHPRPPSQQGRTRRR